MTAEEGILQSLLNEFRVLEGKCIIQRERRIIAEVPQEVFMKVIEHAMSELSFTMLCTITGLDLGEELQAIYHLANSAGVVLNIKLNIPKSNPVISTVTPVFQGASLYERELADMLGFIIKGLSPGDRYPLPDWWPEKQYPLRKGWQPENLGSIEEGCSK